MASLPGMRAVVQRVSSARVLVAGEVVGSTGPGLLVLLGVTHGDTPAGAALMARKLHELRVLRDEQSCATSGAGLLVVSQFTLAADASGGNRPSFTQAAPPEEGRRLFEYFVGQARVAHPVVATGEFGADMQVRLVNDGPVTIALQIT